MRAQLQVLHINEPYIIRLLYLGQHIAGGGFFGDDVTRETRSILYGLLVAAYPFMQFFGAPILGALSDRYGRKPVLLISLAGTLAGYLLFAYSILTVNLPLMFASRMLDGLTGGSISIIYSSLADVSDEKSRTKNFGLVGMAFGLGFIFGPAVGGLLADDTVVSWFNPATPFWFTSVLTLGNILLVQFGFRETIGQHRATRISLLTGLKNIGKSFTAANLRTIFTVVLLNTLGFTFFTQFISVLLYEDFHFTEKNIGYLFGWIGIWLALTQGVLVRRLSKKFSSFQVLPFSMLFLSAGIFALLLPQQAFWFYILNPIIAMAQGVTGPNLTSTVSIQAGKEQQGQILGINQSMQSLGQIVPPLIAAYLNTVDNRLPIAAAALFILMGWLVFVFVFKKRHA